jgi:hypothetical protein
VLERRRKNISKVEWGSHVQWEGTSRECIRKEGAMLNTAPSIWGTGQSSNILTL